VSGVRFQDKIIKGLRDYSIADFGLRIESIADCGFRIADLKKARNLNRPRTRPSSSKIFQFVLHEHPIFEDEDEYEVEGRGR